MLASISLAACGDDAAAGAGGSGAGGSGGGGGSPPACIPADCPAAECLVPSCEAGACATEPAAPGTACQGGGCDGQGACIPSKAAGEPCADGAECASGFCPASDGVCCDAACDGVCVSCVELVTGVDDGTCAPVPSGQDPETECTGVDRCVAGACADHVKVFVSSEIYSSALGGLQGGDAKCQGLASAAGLAGTWMAWLSDATGTPATRFTNHGLAFRRVDGTLVLGAFGSVLTLTNPINLDENGQPGPQTGVVCSGEQAAVWTGTTHEVALYTSNGGNGCNDWSSTTTGGTAIGLFTQTLPAWTHQCGGSVCSAALAALYCFQQ